jgi:hypothetical protein
MTAIPTTSVRFDEIKVMHLLCGDGVMLGVFERYTWRSEKIGESNRLWRLYHL